MNKRSLFKDTIFASIFILLTLFGLSKININSDILNPISKAFGDFKLTDVVFSHLRENPGVDERIVMINIGNVNRDTMAKMMEIIAEEKPKVVGIDAFYIADHEPNTDSALASAFSKIENLVLVSELHENIEKKSIDSISFSNPKFIKHAKHGFADMITEGKDAFKTSRDCIIKENVPIPVYQRTLEKYMLDTLVGDSVVSIPKEEWVMKKTGMKDTTFYSFPVKMASIYAPEKVNELAKRNKDTEIINFQGNIDMRKDGVSSNSKITFYALDWYQVTNREFEPGTLKDKIVIMGFMGEYLGEQSLTDIFFTPLNFDYIGKAYPDMYGVVVHANVLAMILKGEYIDEMPEWINIAISLTAIFLNVWFFSYLYFKAELWYDGLSTVITLIEIFVLMIIVVMVFDKYNYKIDVTLASVALFLTGNLIEIYFGIFKPMGLKLGRKVPYLNKLAIFTKN